MTLLRRIACAVLSFSLVLGWTVSGYGQSGTEAAAAVARGRVRFSSPRAPVDVTNVAANPLTLTSGLVFDAVSGAVIGGTGPATAKTDAGVGGANDDNLIYGPVRHTPTGGTIDGLDTVPTFDGAFFAPVEPASTGIQPLGPGSSRVKLFRYTMMGNHPLAGDTTVIPARIDEVSLQLLADDGSTVATVPFSFEQLVLESPTFEPLDYRSGQHIQYADAIHRAQFYYRMANDWHTVLFPHVVNRVTITVPPYVNVRQADGTMAVASTYFLGYAADGSLYVLMLDMVFDYLFANEAVNEINQGNFTTNGLNMMLFPNTYLFSLNPYDPQTPGDCCTLGYHTFFFDPNASPQPRWITEYASWVSPGIFYSGFEDVTVLTHETSEAFGDPFADNITPSWQFPGPYANSCQSNLEQGDPIEVLPNVSTPITVKEGNFSFTYHPQIIPLLQWFEMSASNAIDGAYSFPDESALGYSASPCPQ